MTGAAIATASADPRELPAPTPGAPVPEWVQLLPAPDARGMIHCRDGRSWLLDDLAGVVAAFAAHGAAVAIDYGHSLDKPERAGTVEAERAAGWLEQLEVRDGALWGRIEWTPRARAMLAAREFRYFSPTLGIDPKTKRVHKLIGGALVARPALRMTALASEEVAPATAPTGGLRARLAAMLGLDPAADEETIIARVADRLHLATMSAEATATTAAGAADPRLDAAAVALAAAVRERAELAAELRRRDAADRVAKAEATGAITPATRGWAVALAESDPAAFDEWVSIAAPVFGRLLRPSGASAAPPPFARAAMAERTDPEAQIAHALGIAPERLSD